MMMAKVDRAGAVAQKKPIGVQALLEWAFRSECAQLDFGGAAETFQCNVGLEYVMMERAKLGCRVDGGGRSDPHPDADVVAAAVAALPVAYGGRGMAICIAEHARAGSAPDWMPGAVPRCLPVEWTQRGKGRTVVVGREKYVARGRMREVEVRMTPVRFAPTAAQIASQRRAYLQWWLALLEIRCSFQAYGGLFDHAVTDAMPAREPWVQKVA